jgi:hypothetical protein
MTIRQRLSLFWRRFSPLEERLLAAVRNVLPAQAQTIFDAQVGAITIVQRDPNEIYFRRIRAGKVDWNDVPSFPRSGEFRLAEVQFSVGGRCYKASLNGVNGHIFDFVVIPNSNAITFADWDGTPSVLLMSDPLTVEPSNKPQPIPDSWRDFLARNNAAVAGDWTLRDSQTAYSIAFADGEFLILADRNLDQFVLHRIEPPASTLFYLDSHDGLPEPIKGDILDFFRQLDIRSA